MLRRIAWLLGWLVCIFRPHAWRDETPSAPWGAKAFRCRVCGEAWRQGS